MFTSCLTCLNTSQASWNDAKRSSLRSVLVDKIKSSDILSEISASESHCRS